MAIETKHSFGLEWKAVPVHHVPCLLPNGCMLADDGV